jgi:predicted kinase
MILLMAPPGSGKTTLGNELNRQGIASYSELEPKLIQLYGEGDEFAKHRATAHLWIWDFYRSELRESSLPVIMETTGIAGRDFINEVGSQHNMLFVKLDTPREVCLARLRVRPRGRNINEGTEESSGEFYDNWHANVAPTYDFGLTVSGTNIVADVCLIRKKISTS